MMRWQYTPYLIPLLIAAGVCAALAAVAWRRRSVPRALPFLVLMLAVAEWSLTYALRLGSVDLAAKLFWAKVRYVGIVAVPTSWLLLSLQHTYRARWASRRNLSLLAIEPVLVLLLVWTNDYHGWVWSDVTLARSGSLWVWHASHGAGFWLHAAYSYCLMLIGSLFLIQEVLHSPRLYRGQAALLLLGALAPLVGNVISTFDLIAFPLDLTPFGFTLAGLAAAWGLLRFRLLDIAPVAREAVVASLSDAVIVLDTQGHIVDLNPAAQKMFRLSAEKVIGQPALAVFAARQDLIQRYRDVTEAQDEVMIELAGERRWYDLRLSPLRGRRDRLSGRLIVFRDVTERKLADEALRAQKQLFESLVAVARATTEQPSLQATLQNVLDVSARLTGAGYGSLFLLGESGQVTHSILALGKTHSQDQQERVQLVMERGLAGWVARHRQMALIVDTSQDARWVVASNEPYTAHSALAVPILSGAGLLGILTLTHQQLGHFSPEHAQLLQAAADQMSLALQNAQMYEAQRHMADHQTTLYRVLTSVGEHLNLEAIGHAAVETIAQLTGWPAVALLLPDDSTSHLVVEAAAGQLAASVRWRIPVERGVVGRAFRTAQTQHVPDVRTDPDYVAGHAALCSELAVPLRRGERLLGVLDIESDRPGAFDRDDVLLAESLAEAVALAMENARLYESANRQAVELGALFTVTRMASRSLVLEDTLTQSLVATLLSLGFDAGLIAVVDPDDGTLRLVAEHGLPSALSQRLRDRGMTDTLIELVHRNRESSLLADLAGDLPPQVAPLVADQIPLGLRACACLPLLHQAESLGVMSLFVHQPRTFSSNEKVLLDTLSHQIATAVANVRLFQKAVDERHRLLTLIESSRDGIVLVNLEHCVVVVNTAALELLRLTQSPPDWTGRSLEDMLTVLEDRASDFVKAIRRDLERVTAADDPAGEGESQVPPRAIHWLNLPVLADQTPLGRLLVLRDVTEERLLAKMRDDLTHTMVHDLRNPLTSLSMSLALLDAPHADNLRPEQRMMLEIAINSVERVSKLVNDILDVSQLESGRMPLDRAMILLNEVVAATLQGQALLAAQKGVHLENDLPPDLPAVLADAQMVERVLQNLVGNAIKFTSSGGRVRVSAEVVASRLEGQIGLGEAAEVCVSVADNGSGVPPELQKRLFQKFVTGQQQESGSGLGLAFCRLAIEAHNGRIWLESQLEQGTQVHFTLPIARPAQTATAEGFQGSVGWHDSV